MTSFLPLAVDLEMTNREAKKTMLLWLMKKQSSTATRLSAGCNASLVAVVFLVKVGFLSSCWIIMSDEEKKNRVEFLHLDGAGEIFESSKGVA